MLEFLATQSIWIALGVIFVVLIWEHRTHTTHFKKRLPEVALQAAGIFLAVALAFEQTSYDRRQQRLNDAQTLVLASALAITVGLEDLARPISIDYDATLTPGWFAIPPVVEKMLTDEKVLASMRVDNARSLSRSIADMKRAAEEASSYAPQPGVESVLVKDRSWRHRTCHLDRIVGSHIKAINGVLAEACAFLTATGQPLPAYLIQSEILPRGGDQAVFSVAQCAVHAVNDHRGHTKRIEASMAGNPEDCSDL